MRSARTCVTLVVPCYNEAERLREDEFARYLHGDAAGAVRLLFVDDGSRDGTAAMLQRIVAAAPPGRAAVLTLAHNQGKAEAVRRGMLQALDAPADVCEVIGFWDCDLATPLDAVAQLAGVLSARCGVQMVFGARVALLGRRITRQSVRHYLGRVFATLASLSLSLPIYDTQCGAKLFRATPALRTVLSAPFLTRWVFDCEMIARFASLGASAAGADFRAGAMAELAEGIYEYPLEEWVDVAGSKVKPTDIVRMAIGLARIRLVYFLHDWPSGKRRPETLGVAAAVVVSACALVALFLAATVVSLAN